MSVLDVRPRRSQYVKRQPASTGTALVLLRIRSLHVKLNPQLMTCYTSRLLAGITMLFPTLALATTLTRQPNPVDLSDLDHHSLYTWRISDINLAGQTITGAKLKIYNIANWDNNPNMLFIHLLDTARWSGVQSFVDDPSNAAPVPVSQIIDDFDNTRYHSQSNWLVAAGTAGIKLTQQSFTTTSLNYVYNFTQPQLTTLAAYLANDGKIAFGIDPDCHFYNTGVVFELTTSPVPEPETVTLFGVAGVFLCVIGRVRAAKNAVRGQATHE